MAVLTKAAIQNNITTFLADNVTGDITPAEVRLILTDMVDSYFDAQATNIGISNIAEFDFVTTPPSIGDHLIWNGTKIVPYTLPNPTLESVLATGNITGAYNIQINSGQRIEWANSGFVNMLVTDTLTSNKTLTLPNITGTLATLGDVKNFSNENLIFAGNRSHNTAGFWLEMTTDGGLYAESWMFMGNAAYARNEYGYANSWTRWAALTQTLYANNIATVYVEGGRVGIGAAPAASTVLDIRAGALSGDLPLRVRDNANTRNLVDVTGQGQTSIRSDTSVPMLDLYNMEASTPRHRFRFQTGGTNSNGAQPWVFQGARSSSFYQLSITNAESGHTSSFSIRQNNFLLGANTAGTTNLTERGVVWMYNLTPPTAGLTDGAKLYSADVVAGNAALHTMSENGDVIKHYSQNVTDIGAGAAFVPNTSGIADDTATWGGFTGGQVVKALLNSGWLKV